MHVLGKGCSLPVNGATARFNRDAARVENAEKVEGDCSLRDWFERAPDIEFQEDVVCLDHNGKTLTVLSRRKRFATKTRTRLKRKTMLAAACRRRAGGVMTGSAINRTRNHEQQAAEILLDIRLHPKLDKLRKTKGFFTEMQSTHALLLNLKNTKTQKINAHRAWLSKNQPSIFGKAAASQKLLIE